MSDHAWVQENIASYLAGGLESAERERLSNISLLANMCIATGRSARPGPEPTVAFRRGAPRRGARRSHDPLPADAPRRYRIGRLVAAIAAVLLVGAIGAGAQLS